MQILTGNTCFYICRALGVITVTVSRRPLDPNYTATQCVPSKLIILLLLPSACGPGSAWSNHATPSPLTSTESDARGSASTSVFKVLPASLSPHPGQSPVTAKSPFSGVNNLIVIYSLISFRWPESSYLHQHLASLPLWTFTRVLCMPVP